MKKLLFLLSFVPVLALAGSYEDMEEAIIRGNADSAIELINRGLDVNMVDPSGNSLLIQTVRRDVPDLFDFLMKRRARLNVRNKNGETALSIAAYMGKQNYVTRLVAAGADVNSYGWSPLIYAAFNGHTDIVNFLLKQGAEIDALSPNGSTALFFAARHGHEEVAISLLKNKADPTIANESGETAYDWAMKAQNTDIADRIRVAGGNSGKSVTIQMGE